ncbi:MAG: YmdB family metallophosphoesterase [Spirochaetes bacterium]|nr:YmdB family metallophosphoesterase [Spirochaetota bacterium]
MPIRVLFVGEIVGKAGLYCIKKLLPELRTSYDLDFVVANGDGVTGGFGIGKNHSIYLRKLGVDCITGGDQIYFKKDMVTHIDTAPYILRAANFPQGNPGRGWRHYAAGERRIAVISVLGQSGFTKLHLANPFLFLPDLIARAKKDTDIVLVDFHAATTAEKCSMMFMIDGTVSALIGTGQRALTADAGLQPKGTAVICDAGRTGSLDSVAGLDPAVEIQQYLTQIPERSSDAWGRLELQGVLLEIEDSGAAKSIQTIRVPCEEGQDDRESESH